MVIRCGRLQALCVTVRCDILSWSCYGRLSYLSVRCSIVHFMLSTRNKLLLAGADVQLGVFACCRYKQRRKLVATFTTNRHSRPSELHTTSSVPWTGRVVAVPRSLCTVCPSCAQDDSSIMGLLIRILLCLGMAINNNKHRSRSSNVQFQIKYCSYPATVANAH